MVRDRLLAMGMLLALFAACLVVSHIYLGQPAQPPPAKKPDSSALAAWLAADNRSDMLILLAGASGDISVCSELFEIGDKEFCYAMARNESGFCSNAEGQDAEWQPNCAAMFSRDSAPCAAILDSEGADICKWNVAVLRSNSSVCGSLSQPDNRDFCRWDVALFTGDVALCDGVRDDYRWSECQLEVLSLLNSTSA
jgi:hypothetical protein